jgi:hypothetical protein
LKDSELQVRRKVESIAFKSLAGVKVVDPASVKVEIALTYLGGVGNDRTNAENTA